VAPGTSGGYPDRAHACRAVGTAELPFDIPVEIEAELELRLT